MNDPRFAMPSSASSPPQRPVPPPHSKSDDPVDLDPLELIDDEAGPVASSSANRDGQAAQAQVAHKKITFGPEMQQRQANYTRQLNANGTGSCRVRSFHGKLSEQGLEYMDHSINEWLDHHPEIEVKFVTSSIGQFDGKMKEPAVILQVWY